MTAADAASAATAMNATTSFVRLAFGAGKGADAGTASLDASAARMSGEESGARSSDPEGFAIDGLLEPGGGGIVLRKRTDDSSMSPAARSACAARSAQMRARFGANGMNAFAISATFWKRFAGSRSMHFSSCSTKPGARSLRWCVTETIGASRIAAQSSVMLGAVNGSAPVRIS